MKRIALVLVLLCLPVIVFAQTSGKLSGTVTSDGQPLVGANVLVKGTSFGGATDENGRYYILDVSVGAYEVEAQYIGYKTMTISNVRVNANLTTELNFSLDVAAVEGEEVQVTAERPLIKKNATNTTAIIEGEVIQALPVRNVSDIIALQAGAVGGNIRGGRDSDNAYYIDGVLMKNRWSGSNLLSSLSQRSVNEVSFQAGGASAEFGNANGGIVAIATASGGNRFSGSAEYLTDLGSTTPGTDKSALYNHGKQLFNFSVGGPITSNVRWYLNVEQEKNEDNSPSSAPAPFADVKEYITLSGSDSSWIWVDGNSSNDLNEGIVYFEEFVRDNQTNTDSLIAGVQDLDTTYVVGSNYQRLYGPKRSGSDSNVKYFGKLDIDMRPLRLKIGAGGYDYEENQYSHTYHPINWNNGWLYNSKNSYLYANGTFSISSKSYLKAIASLNSYEQTWSNSHFGREIQDIGKRTTDIGSATYYYRDHGKNTLSVPALVNFSGYGAQVGGYTERFQDALGLNLSYLNQVGAHEIKAGMEYYSTEIKWYTINQGREIYENMSKLDRDYNGVVSVDEVGDANGDGVVDQSDWDKWWFATWRNAYVDNLGYNIFGESADKYKESDHSLAPGNPVETRYFVQDKWELSDVVVQFGLSYETFNPNAEAPDSDGDGVGDAFGFRNIHMRDGRVDRSGTQKGSYAWKPVETHSAILPRLGFSFPVTDQTVFHAQYGVYWQTPPLRYLYLTDSGLSANLSQGNMTVSENPALKPERTTSYEVGFAQQVGQIAALHVTGYYKEIRDYLMMKNHENLDTDGDGKVDSYPLKDGSEFSWAQYMNGDYGVTQGFSLNFTMRRFKGVMADLNYTYMNARGTGSGASDNFDIAWTGDTYPTTINRLSYDQKHTGSILVDYRSPFGIGLNAVYTFGSGKAYTPTTVQSEVFGRGWDIPVAAINSGDKPWFSRLDLRADYGLKLAGANVNVYLLVQNALNEENVFSVYQGSGQVNDDAWLTTAEGKVWVNGQKENYPTAPAESLYIDRLSDPDRWGIPRIVRLGFQVNI